MNYYYSTLKLRLIILCMLISFGSYAQSPGGVSSGLRSWYKSDAMTPLADGTDIATWPDMATADGAQDAIQAGQNLHPLFGNRQPQYRVSKARYNYYSYLDFTKKFSSLYAHRGHSNISDQEYNYTNGATVYQVGDLTNNQGWHVGTGLGATDEEANGFRYQWGYPWYANINNYYGQMYGFYAGTANDYGWPTTTTAPFSYNFNRAERTSENTIPFISSVSFDKYGTDYNTNQTTNDAVTAVQTRMNGDKWSFGKSYTTPGPSVFIGNELANYNAGRGWDGGITEVFVYDRKLNVAAGNEADRVDSYLGLKYGVTLKHNYYLSDGSTAFDLNCNSAYVEQIAGLVRDDASGLYQKQANSILKKTIISMSLGDIVEFDNNLNTATMPDLYSTVWGSTKMGGTSNDPTEVPGGFAAFPGPSAGINADNATWTAKKWLVQERNGQDIGTVKVYVESADVQALDFTEQTYIVVGTDAAFSNPVYYPLTSATLTAGSSSDFVADINFCEGASNASGTCGTLKTQYFAIAGKKREIAPGGVFRNLKFWARADRGTYNDSATKAESVPGVNSRVREWVNVAGGPNAYNTPADDAPTLRPATRYDNFNPIVSFSGFGLNIASGGENFDSDYARMAAKNALGSDYTSTTGADSIALFSLHRNLTNWYNGTAGVGADGNSPALLHDWNATNSIEMADAWGDVGLAAGAAADDYEAPYSGTAVPDYDGSFSSAETSSRSRTYSSTGFWYPQNSATISNGSGLVDRTLRGNGKTLISNSSTSAAPAYNISRRRRDVGLAGGATADLSGAAIHDAIVYTGGFNAADFEVERIETYMGIRGGVTMLHNYYATDKTLLWDTTVVDALPTATGYSYYNRSITGIGRDDIEGLHQRVSRNAEDTVLTISLGTIPTDQNNASVDRDFENDIEYLIWGSNGASMDTRIVTDLPIGGCLDSRIAREYRLSLTGANMGAYETQVRWELDNNILEGVDVSNISLLIDEDGNGDFTAGSLRSVAMSSYDAVTNTVLFDNVTFSSAGDPDVSQAAMTIAWTENGAEEVVLYNGTATGGGGCTCPGASDVLTVICTDVNGWSYYKNPLSMNKVLAINWGNNVVTSTVTLDVSSTAASRQKSNLDVVIGGIQYDSAAVVGSRMVNITLNSGTITEPVKVRFYIDSTEINNDGSWITSSGVDEPILQDSTWTWMKFEGTVADVLSNLSASGLPVGNGTTANTYSPLVPDITGVDDGIDYVQFDYITDFSTIGYMQTFIKNNNLAVLPLHLLNFNAVLRGNTTNLHWATTQEENVSHFDIERSTDGGKTFEKVGMERLKTSQQDVTDYVYYDDVAGLSGTIFYRLKIVDMDGQYSYSVIRFVRVSLGLQSLEINPNPFSEELTIHLGSDKDDRVVLNIRTLEGKSIYINTIDVQDGKNTMRVDLSQFASGTYILEVLHSDGLAERRKIVKQ